MTSFTEQLSAVRQSQWDAQLDMFRQLSGRALDSTEQLIALNMKASRASMEQAAGAVKHLLEAKDPRDLFALGSAAQGQWHHLFDYSRELLGIATGMRGSWSTLQQAALPAPLRLIPASTANVPTTPDQMAEQAAIAAADAFTVSGEIGAAAVDIGSAIAEAALDTGYAAPAARSAPRPAAPAQASAPGAAASEAAAPAAQAAAEFEKTVDSAIADDVPPARATPLASALNEAAPKPASVEHPIVSTVPLEASGELELPAVAPVERTPPPPAPSRATQAKPGRGSRKK